MDSCFIDTTVEFLAVAFHSILYYTSLYPKSIFEMRKKYNMVVYRSIHPEVNEYIDLCLKSIKECLKCNQLAKIEFVVTSETYQPLVKFVFDLGRNECYNETADAYLVQLEQNLRVFCLKLSSVTNKLKLLPLDRSFSIYIYTNESTAVALATNPDLENFPLIEVDENFEESSEIVPLKKFSIRNYNIDTYVEINT